MCSLAWRVYYVKYWLSRSFWPKKKKRSAAVCARLMNELSTALRTCLCMCMCLFALFDAPLIVRSAYSHNALMSLDKSAGLS